VVWTRTFDKVMGEGDTPAGFVGGVVGFCEDEDVRLVCGSEVFDDEDGCVEAAGIEVDEVEGLGYDPSVPFSPIFFPQAPPPPPYPESIC
jgi:hypothetical protein